MLLQTDFGLLRFLTPEEPARPPLLADPTPPLLRRPPPPAPPRYEVLRDPFAPPETHDPLGVPMSARRQRAWDEMIARSRITGGARLQPDDRGPVRRVVDRALQTPIGRAVQRQLGGEHPADYFDPRDRQLAERFMQGLQMTPRGIAEMQVRGEGLIRSLESDESNALVEESRLSQLARRYLAATDPSAPHNALPPSDHPYAIMAQGAGTMAPSLLAGGFVAKLGMPAKEAVKAVAGVAYPAMYGEAASDLAAAGVDDQTIAIVAPGIAALNSSLEAIVPLKLGGRMVSGPATKTAVRTVGSMMTHQFAEGVEEGITEGAQQGTLILARAMLSDNEELDWEDAVEVAESVMAGFITAIGVGGGITVAQHAGPAFGQNLRTKLTDESGSLFPSLDPEDTGPADPTDEAAAQEDLFGDEEGIEDVEFDDEDALPTELADPSPEEIAPSGEPAPAPSAQDVEGDGFGIFEKYQQVHDGLTDSVAKLLNTDLIGTAQPGSAAALTAALDVAPGTVRAEMREIIEKIAQRDIEGAQQNLTNLEQQPQHLGAVFNNPVAVVKRLQRAIDKAADNVPLNQIFRSDAAPPLSVNEQIEGLGVTQQKLFSDALQTAIETPTPVQFGVTQADVKNELVDILMSGDLSALQSKMNRINEDRVQNRGEPPLGPEVFLAEEAKSRALRKIDQRLNSISDAKLDELNASRREQGLPELVRPKDRVHLTPDELAIGKELVGHSTSTRQIPASVIGDALDNISIVNTMHDKVSGNSRAVELEMLAHYASQIARPGGSSTGTHMSRDIDPQYSSPAGMPPNTSNRDQYGRPAGTQRYDVSVHPERAVRVDIDPQGGVDPFLWEAYANANSQFLREPGAYIKTQRVSDSEVVFSLHRSTNLPQEALEMLEGQEDPDAVVDTRTGQILPVDEMQRRVAEYESRPRPVHASRVSTKTPFEQVDAPEQIVRADQRLNSIVQDIGVDSGTYENNDLERSDLKASNQERIGRRIMELDPSISKESAHRIVDRYMSAWASSAADHNDPSLRLQFAANEMWDLGAQTGHFPFSRQHMSDIEMREARLFLEAAYAETQAQLEKAGYGPDDPVFVIRGVEERQSGSPYGQGDFTNMQPLNSFSTLSLVALQFGDKGYVLMGAVPRSNIVMTTASGCGCLVEGEMLVAGGKYPDDTVAILEMDDTARQDVDDILIESLNEPNIRERVIEGLPEYISEVGQLSPRSEAALVESVLDLAYGSRNAWALDVGIMERLLGGRIDADMAWAGIRPAIGRTIRYEGLSEGLPESMPYSKVLEQLRPQIVEEVARSFETTPDVAERMLNLWSVRDSKAEEEVWKIIGTTERAKLRVLGERTNAGDGIQLDRLAEAVKEQQDVFETTELLNALVGSAGVVQTPRTLIGGRRTRRMLGHDYVNRIVTDALQGAWAYQQQGVN